MVRRSDSKCAMIIISLIMIIAASQLLAATPERNGCGTAAAPGPASVLSRGYSGGNISQSPPVTLALTWGAETSVPETIARYAHAQDPDNPSSLYVICGVANGATTNHTWRYDVGPGTWTALANAPTALEAPDAVITGGKLYLLGGGATNQMSIYDIAANSWSAGPALPRNVVFCSVGCYSGMIYMIGGDDDFNVTSGVSNAVNIFDIAANAWTGTGTSMPTATSAAGYFQIGSYLYIVGGWGAAYPSNVNAVQRYNMATDTWSTGPAIPTPPADFTLAGNTQKLYAIGGDIDGGGFWDSSTQVQSLDLSAWPGGSWVADTSLPLAVQAMNSGFCTPAAVGGTHWLVGGLEGATFTFHAEVYSTPAEACVSAAGSCSSVWDQPLSTVSTNAYVDQDFPDAPTSSSYLADDFTNTAPWTINELSIPGYGWNAFTTLMNATSLNWAIYADSAGIPAGYPGDGVTTPQWSLSLPPGDASIVLSNGSGGSPSNVDVTLSAPPTIPAGTWWLIFWPVMSFSTDGQYGRQPSDTTNGYMTKFINPGGGFGYGTAWQDWTVLGATLQDMAFSICGIEASCDTLLSENFDSAVPSALPAGWAAADVSGTGGNWQTSAGSVHPSGTASHSAPNLAYFNSWTASSGNSTRLYYTTSIDLTGYDTAQISYWMMHDAVYTNNDTLQVQVSTDGGTTWINVGAIIPRYDSTATPPFWTQYTTDLSAYVGQSVLVGLLGVSAYGNDIHVDDIVVEACVSGGCSITITPAALPDATVGVAYSQTLTASGGTAPYTFEVTMGTLPPGLTLDPATGVLSGIPTSGGSYTFTITATDSSACTGTITYTINFDYNWNMSVVDDAGRSSACLNTDTGYYAWTALTGFGAGTYVGRSNVTFSNNTYYFQSGKPSGMNLKVSLTTNKASGTYMSPPLREKSICIDSDITDNPSCP